MAPDISGMPDPTTIGLKPDISGMPDPTSIGLKNPADFSEDDSPSVAEGKALAQGGEAALSLGTGAVAGYMGAIGGAVRAGVRGVLETPAYFSAKTDTERQAVADQMRANLKDDLKVGHDVANFFTYQPRSQGGQEMLQGIEQGIEKGGKWLIRHQPLDPEHPEMGTWGDAYDQLSPSTKAEVKRIGGEAMFYSQAIPGMGAAAAAPSAVLKRVLTRAVARGEVLTGSDLAAARALGIDTTPPAKPAPAPAAPTKPAVSGPVTGESLRAQTNPIPPPNVEAPVHPATQAVQPGAKPRITPRAGESAQDAAARQGITPQGEAQAPGAAAPEPATETPPFPEAPAAGPPSQRGGRFRPGERGGAYRPGEKGSIPVVDPFRDEDQKQGATLFNPPSEEGPQHAPAQSPELEATRQGHLDDLHALAPGVMKGDREGAVTGDWHKTGNEHATSKLEDAPGALLREQIESEHKALTTASDNIHKSTGSPALNRVDKETLQYGGGVVRDAVHAIEDHFTTAADGMFNYARQTLGDSPMPFPARVAQILADPAHDVNPVAQTLRGAASAKLRQLWEHGDEQHGVRTAPGSVGAAQRFNEWLTQAKHNDSAQLVRALKNANMTDIADHLDRSRLGPVNHFATANNVIRHREMLLEPEGVNALRRPKDRSQTDHDVPLDGVLDHVMDMPREQFDHFMNVLRAGAHLGKGELAGKMARAIRVLQGHAVAKIHNGGRPMGSTGWSAIGAYKAANQVSTHLPNLFRDRPELIGHLQTLNSAGNILRMDTAYPGAVAQASKAGILPRSVEKLAKGGKWLGAIGGTAHGGPITGAVAHGAGYVFEKGAKALTERARLAVARKSIRPREEGSASIVDIPQAEKNKYGSIHRVTTHDDGTTRDHSYHTPRGEGRLMVTETPGLGVTQGLDSLVKKSERGQGWGDALLRRAVDDAHSRGQTWRSDTRVSESQQRRYDQLKREGYPVREMPNDNVQGEKHAVGSHVYEIPPPGGETPTGGGGKPTPKYTPADVDAWFKNKERGAVPILKNAGRFPESEGELHDLIGVPRPQEGTAGLPPAPAPGTPRAGSNMPMGELPAFQRQAGKASILNIGHSVEDKAEVLNKRSVSAALAKVGAKVDTHDVIKPGEDTPNLSERTSVVGLKKPLTEKQGIALARELKQKAIAERTGDMEGTMHVPPEHAAAAAEGGWSEFNGDYFHHADRQTETAKATSFNPEELEGAFVPHPSQTVKNPIRNAYPGIYHDVHEIMKNVQTAPEDPILKQLFGVTRKDLHDMAIARMHEEQDYKPPGVKEKGRGSAAAKNVMTEENAARLRATIQAFKEAHPEAYHGMVGWYEMQALYDKVVEHVGEKAAPEVYARLNNLMGMSSPGSDVLTEINRGTAANMMHAQGKFEQFKRHGGTPEHERGRNFPPELENVKGHAYHSTAQVRPMEQYLESGEAQMQSPKVPTYIRSSAAKGQGYQNRVLVGDSHWSRGVGLADVRTAKEYINKRTGQLVKPYAKSVSNPELADLHPWYREQVADKVGLPSVSAQAVQWGALSKETGVNTAIGAPKLELFAQQVKKAAERMKVTPEEALKRIIKGEAHAG